MRHTSIIAVLQRGPSVANYIIDDKECKLAIEAARCTYLCTRNIFNYGTDIDRDDGRDDDCVWDTWWFLLDEVLTYLGVYIETDEESRDSYRHAFQHAARLRSFNAKKFMNGVRRVSQSKNATYGSIAKALGATNLYS